MDKTKIAVGIFDKLATGYQDKFMDVSLYSDSFDFFLKHIKQNASIVELACGPGNITQHLLNKRPDLKILGTDLSPNMISLAGINNPTAEFKLMDCRAIDSLNETYDAVMCGFCLPYLSKEEAIQLIVDSSKVLNQNGIIYISTMEDDYTNSKFEKGSSGDEIFMHYHEEGYLSKALTENNFKITYIDSKHYFSGEKKVTDLILIAEKSNTL